ncbi:hypothetical protein VTN00DRAFT_9104 [Thermoascus crustaceus]|uniref:uncharacterized protein n=1 Tax=Thermoascus crustaceus TaxID=5088 RepID=UPI003743F24F
MATSQPQIKYMDTVEAYDKWAEVYDTDGNFLQALDTIEMRSLLPGFMARVVEERSTANASSGSTGPLKLVDLGCGTGRNTLQLLASAPADAELVGLDASRGMLDVARRAVGEKGININKQRQSQSPNPTVTLETYDLLRSPRNPPLCARDAAGLISTLVIEHVPTDVFFASASEILVPGGYLLLTNMHSDMGAISQAGFVDTATGTKIRPKSYSHTVADVVDAAGKAGFEVVDVDGQLVRERGVDEGMVEVLGKRARKWVGVTVWFGVCFRKRRG